MNWPLEEMAGEPELSFPPPRPARLRLTRVVLLVIKSRRKTSRKGAESSFVVKLLAKLEKTTNRPSPLNEGMKEPPAPAMFLRGLAETGWLFCARKKPAFAKRVISHAATIKNVLLFMAGSRS